MDVVARNDSSLMFIVSRFPSVQLAELEAGSRYVGHRVGARVWRIERSDPGGSNPIGGGVRVEAGEDYGIREREDVT